MVIKKCIFVLDNLCCDLEKRNDDMPWQIRQSMNSIQEFISLYVEYTFFNLLQGQQMGLLYPCFEHLKWIWQISFKHVKDFRIILCFDFLVFAIHGVLHVLIFMAQDILKRMALFCKAAVEVCFYYRHSLQNLLLLDISILRYYQLMLIKSCH